MDCGHDMTPKGSRPRVVPPAGFELAETAPEAVGFLRRYLLRPWTASCSGPHLVHKLTSALGLSAWELACHVSLTIVFAAQRLFALSVSARYRPSQTVPSGTQRARQLSPQVRGDHLIRRAYSYNSYDQKR